MSRSSVRDLPIKISGRDLPGRNSGKDLPSRCSGRDFPGRTSGRYFPSGPKKNVCQREQSKKKKKRKICRSVGGGMICQGVPCRGDLPRKGKGKISRGESIGVGGRRISNDRGDIWGGGRYVSQKMNNSFTVHFINIMFKSKFHITFSFNIARLQIKQNVLLKLNTEENSTLFLSNSPS